MTTKKREEADEKNAEAAPADLRPEFPVSAPSNVPAQTVEQGLTATALAMSACLNQLEAILKTNGVSDVAAAGISNALLPAYGLMTKLLTQPR